MDEFVHFRERYYIEDIGSTFRGSDDIVKEYIKHNENLPNFKPNGKSHNFKYDCFICDKELKKVALVCTSHANDIIQIEDIDIEFLLPYKTYDVKFLAAQSSIKISKSSYLSHGYAVGGVWIAIVYITESGYFKAKINKKLFGNTHDDNSYRAKCGKKSPENYFI